MGGRACAHLSSSGNGSMIMAMEAAAADNSIQELLRKLPSVDHLLRHPAVAALVEDYPRREVVHAVRTVLGKRRTTVQAGHPIALDVPALALDIRQGLYERSRPSLRRVINATGVVLHTGLGRAPLPQEAVDAIADIAGGYCNLELDLETGRRGNRHEHLCELLREICGVEDGLIVNNNAAATYLALNTFAADAEVIISRGQLVEIGGSYRLPDIMAAAQCRMVEVGTTNRTRIGDYERALTDQTKMLLRVHTSNYRIQGFTEDAALSELVELAHRHGALFVDDLGSGLITTDLPWPQPPEPAGDAASTTDEDKPEQRDNEPAPHPETWDEPSVQESVQAGADLTLFSGDKLLGGPQAGVIVGSADLIEALRRNPLARTFRPDKIALAAMETTLRLYRDPETVMAHIPAYRMLSRSQAELLEAAKQLAQQIADALPDAEVFYESDDSEAGGGSLAVVPFPTWVVSVRPPNLPAEAVAGVLRQRDVPIICRRHDEALIFDPRTLEADDAAQIPAALVDAVRELACP